MEFLNNWLIPWSNRHRDYIQTYESRDFLE